MSSVPPSKLNAGLGGWWEIDVPMCPSALFVFSAKAISRYMVGANSLFIHIVYNGHCPDHLQNIWVVKLIKAVNVTSTYKSKDKGKSLKNLVKTVTT